MNTSPSTPRTTEPPEAQVSLPGRRAAHPIRSPLTPWAAACALLLSAAVGPVHADINWDGDNAVGNFSYCNNWYSDGCPGWGVGSGNLVFNYRNNTSQTSLYYDLSWNNINDIIWETTFGAGLVLSGSGAGINFNQRVENRSSYAQTVNIPLSGAQNGAPQIELNPVNADLTISGNLYNDNNKPFFVYGANSKMLTIGAGLTGNSSVSLTIAQFSKVKLTAAQGWGDSTHGVNIQQGEFWLDSGGSLANTSVPIIVGLSDGNIAKLWLSVAGGGQTLNNDITVNNQASPAEKTVGGLNTSGTSTFGGTVTLNGQVNLSAGTGGTVAFAGVISGRSQNVVVNGYGLPSAGTIIMSAANTYSGNTYISGGTLQFNSGGSAANSPNFYLGETSGSQTATLTLGATGGGQTLNNPITVRSGSTGTKTISSLATSSSSTLGGNIALNANLTVSSAGGGNLNLNGVISGSSFGLANTGSGTLTLSGANTYGGATAIRNGTVVVSGGNDRLPTGTAVTLGAGTTSGVLQLGDAGGACNQTLAGLAATGTGGRVVGGNASTCTLTINNGSDFTYDGFLGGPSANQNNLALIKTGTGALTLSADNSFAGGTTIRAGTIAWKYNTPLGSGTVTLNDAGTGSSATSLFRYGTGTLGVAIVVANQGSGAAMIGSGSPTTGTIIYTGGVTLYRNATLQAGSTGDTRFSGVISGSGGVTVTGSGTLSLNAANTYSGDTRVSSATLVFGNANSLQDSTLDLNSADAGGAGVGSGVTSLTLGGLKGTRNWSMGIPISIGNNGQDTSYSGSLQGTMSLTKIGGGTLTLSGANSYSGNTTNRAGTLLVNGSIGSGAVAVQNTATLGGNGAIGGNITVQSGGLLAPGASSIGASVGTLTLASGKNVTLNSDSGTGMEVNRSGLSSDLVTGIGTLTMGGTLYVTNNGPSLQVNDSFTLLSANNYSGEFAAISPANPNGDSELAWDKPALKISGVLRAHHVPYATNKTIVRTKDMSAKIKLSELFPSPDPLDTDTVVLEGFTAGSQSASITSNATYIFYTPANDNSDSFDYTVKDSRGAKRTRTITVNVGSVTGQGQQISVVGGKATMVFAGIPGYTYDVERAEDVNFAVNLTTVLTTNLPTTPTPVGVFTFVDNSPPGSQAYYRLKYNP